MIKPAGGSPAVLIAVLAIVAALAGTAIAGPGPAATTSGQKAAKALRLAKKFSKTARKNRKAIEDLAAVAGQVSASGELSGGNDFLKIAHPSIGVICILPKSDAALLQSNRETIAVVTPDGADSSTSAAGNTIALAEVNTNLLDCPDGWQVNTYRLNSGVLSASNEAFTFALYGSGSQQPG